MFIIDRFSSHCNEIEASMMNWRKTSLLCRLPGLECAGLEQSAVQSTLRLFMAHGPVASCESASVPDSAFSGELARIRDAIVASGFGRARGTGWTLTSEGVNEMSGAKALSHPQPFFRVRDGLALQDRTEYELLKILQDGGWTWQLWVPPSKRRRSDPHLPAGFRRNAPLLRAMLAPAWCAGLSRCQTTEHRTSQSRRIHAQHMLGL